MGVGERETEGSELGEGAVGSPPDAHTKPTPAQAERLQTGAHTVPGAQDARQGWEVAPSSPPFPVQSLGSRTSLFQF